jgi:hypothetical protein
MADIPRVSRRGPKSMGRPWPYHPSQRVSAKHRGQTCGGFSAVLEIANNYETVPDATSGRFFLIIASESGIERTF